jgi:hypothetical protein
MNKKLIKLIFNILVYSKHLEAKDEIKLKQIILDKCKPGSPKF